MSAWHRILTIAAVCREWFRRRSPPRLRRCRTVLPEDAGVGLTPARAENAAAERTRPGCDHAVRTTASVRGPMPVLSKSGAVGLVWISSIIRFWLVFRMTSREMMRSARRMASSRAVAVARSSLRVHQREISRICAAFNGLRASRPRPIVRYRAVSTFTFAVRSVIIRATPTSSSRAPRTDAGTLEPSITWSGWGQRPLRRPRESVECCETPSALNGLTITHKFCRD